MAAVRSEFKIRKKAKDVSELKPILSKLPCDLRRATISRSKATGQWISVIPLTGNGGPYSRLEYIETLTFSATGDVLEISNLIVMVVTRSLVFNMLLSATKWKYDLTP